MNLRLNITQVSTIEEIPNYWSEGDFRALLKEFDFSDADSVPSEELKEMLLMAITDLEPEEAAERILAFKLGDRLTAGQIQQLSHEMLDDKVSEEYADISFHYPLFSINQLLYEAFNGKFPHVKASQIHLQIDPPIPGDDPAIVLQAIGFGLSERSLLKRLYEDELAGKAEFGDAEHIIWEWRPLGGDQFELITSDYWLNEEDIEQQEFSGKVEVFVAEEEED